MWLTIFLLVLLCAPCVHQRVHSVRTAHCQHMLFHKLMSKQSVKQLYNNMYLVTIVPIYILFFLYVRLLLASQQHLLNNKNALTN